MLRQRRSSKSSSEKEVREVSISCLRRRGKGAVKSIQLSNISGELPLDQGAKIGANFQIQCGDFDEAYLSFR